MPRLFVNVSAVQFTHELPTTVAAVLLSNSIGPERLTLETTESQLPSLSVNEPMGRLRATGVHIALDDFGAGYSSLAQLARLPVDVLKIDRDVVSNLGESAGRSVMDAVINLATSLGLSTVAEGIEDLGQAAEAATPRRLRPGLPVQPAHRRRRAAAATAGRTCGSACTAGRRPARLIRVRPPPSARTPPAP